MEQWLESVYSDGTDVFVSNPQPSPGEWVQIQLRLYEDAPVQHVILRSVPNGAETLMDMYRYKTENGLAYYEAWIQVNEKRLPYHFYLVSNGKIYYYNQKGITAYIPDSSHDFVLLTEYRQPSWVKSAVFYQIFPERFCNGNPENDVKDGEYRYRGNYPKKMSWNDRPLSYYEGFSMDFFGGDLEGVQEKIGYLKELGVTAVYLNPIFQAPSIHKYDCVDYYHVDPHFGGDEALANLTKALHENGMKVILDISINHTGVEHRWFNMDGVFFDKSEGGYHHPDSRERDFYFFEPEGNGYHKWAGIDTLPTLDYRSEALRDEIFRAETAVLRKWLKPPYNIDGWRFDVADVFARNNQVQLAHELWPQIRTAIREENPDAYILAEDWGDCTQYLQGSEWDSPMNYFGCARVLRSFLGLPDFFLCKSEVLKNISHRCSAEEVQERVMQYLAKIPYVLWQNQFNLLDSHDFARVHNYSYVNQEEYRGAVIMQFMLIGTPSVYYGDEVGIDGDIYGDEGYRHTMPWNEIPERNRETYEFYRKLMHLKQQSKVFQDGGMKFLYAKDKVVALARFYQNKAYVAVMSVSEGVQRIRLPLKAIGVLQIPGEWDVFGRRLRWESSDDKGIWLDVQPHQAYLIEM